LVAVYDLKENRIPNYCLLLLIVLYVLEAFAFPLPLSEVGMNILAAIAMFSASMLLFFLRAMAPGDVKLLGVLGYWIGWGNLLSTSFYILLSAGVIGLLFILYDLASPTSKYRNLILLLDKENRERYVREDNLRMPFAPAVLLGLALHQYYSF
jgi:prepilin peptidase CpaA